MDMNNIDHVLFVLSNYIKNIKPYIYLATGRDAEGNEIPNHTEISHEDLDPILIDLKSNLNEINNKLDSEIKNIHSTIEHIDSILQSGNTSNDVVAIDSDSIIGGKRKKLRKTRKKRYNSRKYRH